MSQPQIPSIRNLKYLLALKQHLHFGNAAQACFVSQSTLSVGLQNLEEGLGVQLVERDNRSVHFTPVGLRVAEQAQQVIVSMQDLLKVANTHFFQSHITIGVIPTIAAYLLPDFMAVVKQQHPKLSISIVEDTSQNLLTRVERFEIDFAIFAFPFAESEHITQHVVFKDKLHLVKHKGWDKDTIGQGDLLLLEQGHCLRKHIVNQANIRPSQIAASSFSNLDTLVAMIDHQIGVSFLPKMAIKNGILKQYPKLQIDKIQPKIAREIGLIYYQDSPWEEYFIQLGEYLRLAKRA